MVFLGWLQVFVPGRGLLPAPRLVDELAPALSQAEEVYLQVCVISGGVWAGGGIKSISHLPSPGGPDFSQAALLIKLPLLQLIPPCFQFVVAAIHLIQTPPPTPPIPPLVCRLWLSWLPGCWG